MRRRLYVHHEGQVLELEACGGGLWPDGIGEAAILCNPEFKYDDSYGTRLDGTRTWLLAWHNDLCYPEYAEGALVTIETCPAWEKWSSGITRMMCSHRVKEARQVDLRLAKAGGRWHPPITDDHIRSMRPLLEGTYYMGLRLLSSKFDDVLPPWMGKYSHRYCSDVAKRIADNLEDSFRNKSDGGGE